MLDFKKNGPKILTIIATAISCASFALSIVALNNSKKQFHGESFKCSQGSSCIKNDGMKHPKFKHQRDCDQKNPPIENKDNKDNSENPQKDHISPENSTENKKSDK